MYVAGATTLKVESEEEVREEGRGGRKEREGGREGGREGKGVIKLFTTSGQT